MTIPTLPSELCARIIQYARQVELLAICLTNKELNRIAERNLYSDIILRDAQTTLRFCHSLLAREGYRGLYTRRFWFWHEPRRGSRTPLLPEHFWIALQKALSCMTELEELTIVDPSLTNTWILNPGCVKFNLVSARLHLAWDANLVAFLNTQTRLQSLQVGAPLDEDEGPCALEPGKLSTLQVFEGALLVAAELYACPLTHLRLFVEEETVNILPIFIDSLLENNQHLRSLSVLHVHPRMAVPLLEGLTAKYSFATRLRYLGIICMPLEHRHRLYKYFMQLDHLQILEVEMSHWEPQPTHAVAQRTLASEFRTYCPSLQMVVFRISHHHTTWAYVRDEWTHEDEAPRSSQNDTLWRAA